MLGFDYILIENVENVECSLFYKDNVGDSFSNLTLLKCDIFFFVRRLKRIIKLNKKEKTNYVMLSEENFGSIF
jgi:hypothetical protein